MESAIPRHLQCPRTRAARANSDFVPPYPAMTARFPQDITQLVMAYLGVQCAPGKEAQAWAAVQALVQQLGHDQAAPHHDIAHFVDDAGFPTWLVIAYWPSVESFKRWSASPGVTDWWDAPERCTDGLGYFREVFMPRISHFETLFSNDRLEGAARMPAGKLSDDAIQEHGYWGGMRDRLPASQTDDLASPADARIIELPSSAPDRIRLIGHDHIALIRSGQDWTETVGQERELYLHDIEPTLRAGMDFLSAQGPSVGCYVNRYVRLLDAFGQETERSFGMSLWHTLEHMERWSESHITHVNIFGRFMNMVGTIGGPNLKLRLYHEVTVVRSTEQIYEYVNCHPHTGLLRAHRASHMR